MWGNNTATCGSRSSLPCAGERDRERGCLRLLPSPVSSPIKGNAVKLSRGVIASAAKQSLFFQEIAPSLTLLARTAVPSLNAIAHRGRGAKSGLPESGSWCAEAFYPAAGSWILRNTCPDLPNGGNSFPFKLRTTPPAFPSVRRNPPFAVHSTFSPGFKSTSFCC
jgi:hypothetical protein